MLTVELPLTAEWTPEVLEGLSREYRYEVSRGKLIVSAAAMRPWHAEAEVHVRNLLRAQGRLALIEQGVVIGPGEIVTCDVGVFRDPPSGKVSYHPAREFELVVEVVSPDSGYEDRHVKPGKYAAGGIPEFWRVEEAEDGDGVIHIHRLTRIGGGLVEYAETRVVLLSTLEEEGQ